MRGQNRAEPAKKCLEVSSVLVEAEASPGCIGLKGRVYDQTKQDSICAEESLTDLSLGMGRRFFFESIHSRMSLLHQPAKSRERVIPEHWETVRRVRTFLFMSPHPQSARDSEPQS